MLQHDARYISILICLIYFMNNIFLIKIKKIYILIILLFFFKIKKKYNDIKFIQIKSFLNSIF
jgi:hypothetical protein